VLHGVANGYLACLAYGHECVSVELRSSGYRLLVVHCRPQREILDIPIGQPIATLVVPHDCCDFTKRIEKVPKHWVIPVVLKVADPVLAEYQRRSNTMHSVSNTHPIRPTAEADLFPGARLATHCTSLSLLLLHRWQRLRSGPHQAHNGPVSCFGYARRVGCA
jgi:hypothetical protein